MGKNTSVSLSDHFDRFIDDQVKSGRYGSVSEVIRDALRMMEAREAKLEALRRAIDEGLESGPVTPFDIEHIIAAAKGESRQRAAEVQDR
jgi:antitoxin ParD1/3/4